MVTDCDDENDDESDDESDDERWSKMIQDDPRWCKSISKHDWMQETLHIQEIPIAWGTQESSFWY